MPGPILFDPTPEWLKPQETSVFDSPLTKALRHLAGLIGANDPTAQIAAPMAPLETGPAGGLLGAAQKFIKAYHGSPHDFDQFSMQKIGTGEGAQAYGHGLYFAENEKTARAYRDNLSNFGHASSMPDDMSKSVLLDGKVVSGNEPSNRLTAIQRAALAKHYAGGIQARAIQDVEESLKYMTPGTEAYRLDQETLDVLKSTDLTGRVQPFRGRMYEVNIHADPEQFLDWDKPLSEQSQQVRDALERDWLAHPEDHATHTGRDIYRATTNDQSFLAGKQGRLQDTRMEPAQAAASRELREAGIPGIKYLDQGSRSAGEGTRNYVVFDDKLIEILRKYGLVGPATLASLERYRQESQQQ